jgi:hypothetical protein
MVNELLDQILTIAVMGRYLFSFAQEDDPKGMQHDLKVE